MADPRRRVPAHRPAARRPSVGRGGAAARPRVGEGRCRRGATAGARAARSSRSRWPTHARRRTAGERGAACGRSSTRPVSSCTPTSAGRRCRRPPSTRWRPPAGAPMSSSTWPPGQRARRGRGALAALAGAVPDRGRRARRQQQRRRPAADRDDAGPRQGDRGQPWRAGRDRRRLPDARTDGLDRRPDPRGRHDQPHASARLRRGHRARHRLHAQGPPVELSRQRIHRVRRHRRAGQARPRRSWSTSAPAC